MTPPDYILGIIAAVPVTTLATVAAYIIGQRSGARRRPVRA